MEKISGNEKMPSEMVFEKGEMKLEYTELPFGSKAVEIEQPDKEMFAVVNSVMRDSLTGSEAYNATKDCGAFWQVGQDADTDYIQLEFWKPDEAAHRAFIALLIQRYTKKT